MGEADVQPTPVEAGESVWTRFTQVVLSLQCKATVLVVALTLSVTAAVSGYFLHSSSQLVAAEHGEKMTELASMLAKLSAAAMADKNVTELKSLAREAADGAPLEFVVFSDVAGKALASAEHRPGTLQEHARGPQADPPIAGVAAYHFADEAQLPCLHIEFPINRRGAEESSNAKHDVELVGYLRTGMLATSWYRSMASTLDLVVGVGILAIMVAIPLGFLLVRRIISPLDALADIMHRFSHGQMDIRSPVRRSDEIGRLTAAFNRMANQHQQTHDGIVRLNVELEERVARRTRQLRELAARDPLTGLYNRRHFSEMLERSFSEAKRYDNDLSCIMMDLDDFKRVNDSFGHQVGDEVLVMTASTINSRLRSADVPARFGGDEFIVLLPQTDAERAHVLGQRIVEIFASEVAERFTDIQIGMSMGIASVRSLQIADTKSLILAADRAMYKAKDAGSNHVVVAADAAVATSTG